MARVRKKISQREALRLRKRVGELLRERAAERAQWQNEFPGGVNVLTFNYNALTEESKAKLELAKKFSDIFVAKADGSALRVFAIPR